MSRSLSYNFPPGEEYSVCTVQDVTAESNFVLNGPLSNEINSQVSFLEHGYSRSISITSVNDLSGAIITITGTQNGAPIILDIAGPDNETVYSIDIFDVITSIQSDIDVIGIEIGTGFLGFFPMININLERSYIKWSFTAEAEIFVGLLPIPISVHGAVRNISNNGLTYLENLAEKSFVEIEPIITTDIFYKDDDADLFRSILINIEGDEATIGEGIQFDFIQI